MKKLILLLPMLIFLLSCSFSRKNKKQFYALTNVTIIDPTITTPSSNMTVIVKGNQIVQTGKTDNIEIPNYVKTIDCKDKFIIPGLWDMHVHCSFLGGIPDDQWFIQNNEINKNIFFPLFLANGITSIRDVGGDLEKLLKWQDEINQGVILGPRMIFSGPMLNYETGFFYDPFVNLNINSPEAAQKEVSALKRNGVDFIKVISLPSSEVFHSIANEAIAQGISFVGHSDIINALEASRAGMKSFEHLGGILLSCSSKEDDFHRIFYSNKEAFDTYDEDKANMLFNEMVKNETWVCPTLVLYDHYHYDFYDIDTLNDARLNYIPSYWKEKNWMPHLKKKYDVSVDKMIDEETFQRHVQFVGTIHDAGIKLLAGTDCAAPYIFPGFSLLEELILFVEAGLTPLESLQTATINPAEFFNMSDSLGTVEEGKIADLVLLDANPLADIKNIQTINSVILNGKLLTKNDIQKLLSGVKVVAGKY